MPFLIYGYIRIIHILPTAEVSAQHTAGNRAQ